MACCGCLPDRQYVTERCQDCDNARTVLTCVTAAIGAAEPILRMASINNVTMSNLCGSSGTAARCCLTTTTYGLIAPGNGINDGIDYVRLMWRVRHDCSFVDFDFLAYTSGLDGRPIRYYSDSEDSTVHDGVVNGFPPPSNGIPIPSVQLPPWPIGWHLTPQTLGPYTITAGCDGVDPQPIVNICCMQAETGPLFPDPDYSRFLRIGNIGPIGVQCIEPHLSNFLTECVGNYYNEHEPNEWCGSLFGCWEPFIGKHWLLAWVISPDLSTMSVGLYLSPGAGNGCHFTGLVPAMASYHAFVPAANWWESVTLTATGQGVNGAILAGLQEEVTLTVCGSGYGSDGYGDYLEPCFDEELHPLFVDIDFSLQQIIGSGGTPPIQYEVGGTFAMTWTGSEYTSGLTTTTVAGVQWKVRLSLFRETNAALLATLTPCASGSAYWTTRLTRYNAAGVATALSNLNYRCIACGPDASYGTMHQVDPVGVHNDTNAWQVNATIDMYGA